MPKKNVPKSPVITAIDFDEFNKRHAERIYPIMRELDRAFSSHTLHILGKRLKSAEFLKAITCH